MLKRANYVIGSIFLAPVVCLALFWVWFCIAANYDYSALAGTYKFQGNGTSSILVLRADRSFHQEVSTAGKVQTADGTWHRIGEGGVDFSIGFLAVPGAKTYAQEFPDHLDGNPNDDNAYYGRFEKIMTIYPKLTLNANPSGPTFYKQLFH